MVSSKPPRGKPARRRAPPLSRRRAHPVPSHGAWRGRNLVSQPFTCRQPPRLHPHTVDVECGRNGFNDTACCSRLIGSRAALPAPPWCFQTEQRIHLAPAQTADACGSRSGSYPSAINVVNDLYHRSIDQDSHARLTVRGHACAGQGAFTTATAGKPVTYRAPLPVIPEQ